METTFRFLKRLKKNNDREWFKAHKEEYDDARAEFTGLVGELIERVAAFDPVIIGTAPDDCLFRIYRDIRFSKDKSPYKTNFGASINPGGRKSPIPGYYIHVEPSGSFLAGGSYTPGPADLLAIRNAIVTSTEEFLKIPKNKTFRKYFGNITSRDELKTAPKGFPKDHPAIRYLRMKGLIAYCKDIDDKVVRTESFPAFSSRVFRAMMPLIDFLREAVGH